MAKTKIILTNEQYNPPDDSQSKITTNALVLFGGAVRMLPAELDNLGLTGKVQTREIPGVPPSWKPVNPGDFLLGRCVDRREQTFDAGTPKERKSTVLIFDTPIPGGFRSVWLGADLRLKLHDPIGKVYQIRFEGLTTPNLTSQKLNPMKTFTVYEVMPTEAILPEGIETLEDRQTPSSPCGVIWVDA